MHIRGNPILKSLDRRLGVPLVRLLSWRTRKDLQPPPSPGRILLIKMGAIGDTLLTLPSFQALKDHFPSAHFTLLHMPANREVAIRAPGMEERMELDLKTALREPFSFLKWLLHLRRRDFDLVLDFEPWSRLSALLSILSGATYRIGFRTGNQHRHAAYHRAVEHRADAHELDNNLHLAESAGATTQRNGWVFPVTDADASVLGRLRKAGADFSRAVVFHPWSAGYKGHFKEWPADRFAELGRKLHQDGCTVFITGGPDDRKKSLDLRDRIGVGCRARTAGGTRSAMDGRGGCIVLAGETTLGETAAVMQASKLVVCVNTGALHLAAAVGANILLLDGPAGELRWGPISKKARVIKSEAYCSPCLHLGFEYQCRTGWCMREIEVEQVYRAARECLHSNEAGPSP